MTTSADLTLPRKASKFSGAALALPAASFRAVVTLLLKSTRKAIVSGRATLAAFSGPQIASLASMSVL